MCVSEEGTGRWDSPKIMPAFPHQEPFNDPEDPKAALAALMPRDADDRGHPTT